MERVRLAFVVSKFNFDVTYLMLQRALSHAELLGAEVKVVVKVPETFEIPVAVAKLLKRGRRRCGHAGGRDTGGDQA